MNVIKKLPLKEIGYNFIPAEFLPPGNDEFYIRNRQFGERNSYRQLSAHEIEVLVKNDNTADNWNDILVTEAFNPALVKHNQFHGFIRIGDLDQIYLQYHDVPFPVGIYDSKIISCDLGSNVSIHNVDLLSHYIIDDEAILSNVNEMVTTNYAKFGNGIIKEGEKEDIRIWVEVSNENGGRRIIPFDGMTAGDAWIWSRYRDRPAVMERLKKMTQSRFDTKRGYYGHVGKRSVLKHCRILKDVCIGSDAYIKGANKLKNLTINSSPEAPSQIGEGVEMVNGIVGFGCHIFYGSKAVRFVMDDHTNLKYGARLINSFLGNNSTISCCEVLNALIYPGHEQHHNSSFLCASTILGQSNMASGATIGSNHNSRGNDGEILAGRGFWPGLSTSLKHNCRFASFNLLVKGAYPSEIDNPFPFSLLSNSEKDDCLLIRPAYWFRYNMYALARNSWKYGARDKRIEKSHLIAFDYLAPDTVNEIFGAMEILRSAVTETESFKASSYDDAHSYLINETIPVLNINRIESGRRDVRILKPCDSYRDYLNMVTYYGVKTVVEGDIPCSEISGKIEEAPPRAEWENIGGQLIRKERVDSFLKAVEEGILDSWDSIHSFYTSEAESYPENLAEHALGALREILTLNSMELSTGSLQKIFQSAIEISKQLTEGCYQSRAKDYSNSFRNMMYSSDKERDAVLGALEDNSFIIQAAEDAAELEKKISTFLC